MKALNDIFSGATNPLSRRMLAIIAIVALIFPIVCARVQFRCTLRGQIHAAFWMYVAPAALSFVLVRVYQAASQRRISLPLVFMTSWALASVIICNGLVAPFFVDATLMIALHHHYLQHLVTWSAIGKVAISYYSIYQSVISASLPATALICLTFLTSCLIVPLGEADSQWMSRVRSMIAGMITQLPFYEAVRDGLASLASPMARGAMIALLILAVPQSPRSYVLTKEFARIDRNHDGVIDQHEFVRWVRDTHRTITPPFSEIDIDHSTKIDQREWNKFFGVAET